MCNHPQLFFIFVTINWRSITWKDFMTHFSRSIRFLSLEGGGVEGAAVFLFRGRIAGGWGGILFSSFAGDGGRLSSSSPDNEQEEGDDGGVGKTNFVWLCCCWSFLPSLVCVVSWLEQIEKCWIRPLIYLLPFFNWARGISTELSEENEDLLSSLPCCLSCSCCLDFLLSEFAN